MYEFLEYRVQDAMTADPMSISPDATLSQAEELFGTHEFNSLPVVEGDRLVGLLNQLDLLKAFQFTPDSVFPPYEKIMASPVRDVMCTDVVALQPRTPLTRVLDRMVRERRRSYPVVDGTSLVGMITREDVIAALRRAVGGERATSPY